MEKNNYSMLALFDEFLKANGRNKRRMGGGRELTPQTKKNYQFLYKLLSDFHVFSGFPLRIKVLGNNKRLFNQEKNYHKKFYLKFTSYLFYELDLYDNYVGHNIKMLRTFYRWLVANKGLQIGEFYREFHVWKEDIPILALSAKQLQFLIFDSAFEERMTKYQQKVKDIFVFGCTTALRVSDIRSLSRDNLEDSPQGTYFKVYSKKTHTYSKIKLPEYAVNILLRNRNRTKKLFNLMHNVNFNHNIKKIAEMAGWTYECPKYRTKMGKPFVVYKNKEKKEHFRYCDLLSSHTMRRTAITTMLDLGMEEKTVRRISGHAPGSVEFYKYVKHNQNLIEKQTILWRQRK